MDTVTLRQPTNMADLPTSLTQQATGYETTALRPINRSKNVYVCPAYC